MVTVPYELLANECVLSMIFIYTKGLTVIGEVRIAGKDICQISNCIFCRHAIRTIQCWSPFWKYCAYTVGIILGLTTLCLVKFLLTFFLCILKLVVLSVYTAVRLFKATARVSLLTGNFIGIKIIKSAVSTMEVLEAERTNSPSKQNSKYLLIALLCISGLSEAKATCSDSAILSSELRLCETQGPDTKTCRLNTVAELTLKSLKHETCLLLQDKSGTNIVSLKLKLNSVQCDFTTQQEYFTFPVEPKTIAQTSCVFDHKCGRGFHCYKAKFGNTGVKFQAETEESLSYPGLTNCLPGGIGTGCFIVTRAACNFYRVYYVPDLLKSFGESRITGCTCNYHIGLEHLENNTLTQITVKDVTETRSGIQVSVLGSFDQSAIFIDEKLVQRMANRNEGFLMNTSPRNSPQVGKVGVVQANQSFTKHFIFNPDMSHCDFYESSLRCNSAHDPILRMMETKETALPITRDLHLLQLQNGKLKSTLLASSAVKIQLRFTNFKLEVHMRTVRLKFTSNSIQVSGCYRCQQLAHATFSALSTCQTTWHRREINHYQVFSRTEMLQREAVSKVPDTGSMSNGRNMSFRDIHPT